MKKKIQSKNKLSVVKFSKTQICDLGYKMSISMIKYKQNVIVLDDHSTLTPDFIKSYYKKMYTKINSVNPFQLYLTF